MDLNSEGSVFLTGLSASGKSSLGQQLTKNLAGQGVNKVKLLDGEVAEMIGVSEPYQKSDNTELTLDTGKSEIPQCSEILLCEVITFFKLFPPGIETLKLKKTNNHQLG